MTSLRTRRLARTGGVLIAASALAALGSTGCAGGKSGSETRQEGRVFSAEELIREFEARTGYRLADLKSPAIPGIPPVHRLDVHSLRSANTEPSKSERELVKRYGHFSIFVYDSARHAREALQGSVPDERGIYWTEEVVERGPYAGERSLIAEKLYPENVILAWSSDRRRLDDRWQRLDELLNTITRANEA